MIIDYTHVHAYTPESATTMVEKAGWTVEQVERFTNSGAFGMVAHRMKTAPVTVESNGKKLQKRNRENVS